MTEPPPSELVVLVDEQDAELGTAEKLAAHRDGLRHRAVSVLVFDANQRLLLQRRAVGKYHSGGRWSNTCCSHPRPGETALAAAERRLREELGLQVPLRPLTTFHYRAAVAADLVEDEIDHVFLGFSDAVPAPDPSEVAECTWVALPALERAIAESPERYTAWLPPLLAAVRAPLARVLQVEPARDDRVDPAAR